MKRYAYLVGVALLGASSLVWGQVVTSPVAPDAPVVKPAEPERPPRTTGVPALVAPDAPPVKSALPPVDAAKVKQLIADLDADEFKVRNAAQKELEKIGTGSSALLQQTLKEAVEPETRRRLEELISNIERASALGGTRITLSAKEKLVREVVEELARQSGYKLDLYQPGGNDDRERRVISLDLKDVPFWTALQEVCELGGLIYQEGYYGNDQTGLRLEYGQSYPAITSVNGPFRISVRNFYFNRNVEFVIGHRNQGEGGPIRRYDSLSVGFNITSEPKSPLLGAAQPIITEAIDDQNQSMVIPRNSGMDPNHFNQYGGYRAYMMQVQGQLQPSVSGKKLKTLKGTIPVQVVYAQTPRITVEDLLEVKNKTFKEGKVTLNVAEATKNNNQVTVKLTLTDASPGLANNYAWINTVQQRLEIYDDKGNKLRNYGANSLNGNGGTVDATLVFGLEDGNGRILRPAVAPANGNNGKKEEPKFKLVYNEWSTMVHQVPFEFKDVPLP